MATGDVPAERTPQAPTQPDWQQELQQAGLVRRALRGRLWYGGDWWFVVIGILMMVGFLTMALIPGYLAPFDPREEVGPRLLAPGESPEVPIIDHGRSPLAR